MSKYVYFFGGGKADGRADMKDLLGGKGANLAEMTNIGLPVPAGFTITTEVCTYFYAHGTHLPARAQGRGRADALQQDRRGHGRQVRRRQEPAAGLLPLRRPRLHAGHDGHRPQHRPQRQPPLSGLIEKTGNERFAWDSYRRFVQMYGDVVLGLKPPPRPRSTRSSTSWTS